MMKKYIHALILDTIIILIINKYHYKIRLRETSLASNTSASLKITSAAETHPAAGQFLIEEQILDKDRSIIYRAGTRIPTVFRRGQDFEQRYASILLLQ
jgi:hypothetical protein